MKNNFWKMLQQKLKYYPPASRDQKILLAAKNLMSPPSRYKNLWLPASSFALLAIFCTLYFSSSYFKAPTMDMTYVLLIEKQEFLEIYEDLEYIEDSIDWTPQEWNYILTGSS
ncbi:MAG: hypothetical protein QE271_03810 [Bacteriovoracaceae bacterium]|nr:hypothetical protein [Bacteriovoracaceae bacterium]